MPDDFDQIVFLMTRPPFTLCSFLLTLRNVLLKLGRLPKKNTKKSPHGTKWRMHWIFSFPYMEFTGLNEEKCSCESTQFGRIFPIPWGKSCNCCPRCLRMNFNWRIAYQASKPCIFELNSRENRTNETLLNCLLSLWWLENWTRLLIFFTCILLWYLHSTFLHSFLP